MRGTGREDVVAGVAARPERQGRDEPGGLDPRQRPHPRADGLVERLGLHRRPHRQGDGVVHREAGIDAEEAPEAARHERRPHQERQRQAELRHDHAVAQTRARCEAHGLRLQRVLRRHLARADGRTDACEDAGDQGRRDRHRQYPRIDGDLGHPRDRQRAQRLDAPRREEDAQGAAERGDHQALDEPLRDRPAARLTEGAADGEIEAASGGPHEQQIREVRAGDEQEQADGAEQHQQRPPESVADDVLDERDEAGAPAALAGRHRRRDLRRDRLQLAIGRLDRHAGRESREDVELVVQAVLRGHVGLHRHRDLDVAGQRQADRRHADDGVGLPVELQRLADDVGPAAEVPAPEPVRDDRDSRAVRAVLVRGEVAPLGHPHTECVEEIGRDPPHLDQLWVGAPGQVHGAPRDRGHRGEARRARLEVDVVRHRDREERHVALEVRLVDGDEAIGLGERERLQHHRVDGAEHRRRRTDADGSDEHRDGGEAGRDEELADGVAQGSHPIHGRCYVRSATRGPGFDVVTIGRCAAPD